MYPIPWLSVCWAEQEIVWKFAIMKEAQEGGVEFPSHPLECSCKSKDVVPFCYSQTAITCQLGQTGRGGTLHCGLCRGEEQMVKAGSFFLLISLVWR